MKYDSSRWKYIGDCGISGGICGQNSISFDKNNIPYIVFNDDSSYNIRAMKYDTLTIFNIDILKIIISDSTKDSTKDSIVITKKIISKWQNIGSGIVANSYTGSAVITLLFDKKNTPYVAFYLNIGKDYYPAVRKYDGKDWITVGNFDFSNLFADYLSFAMDSLDNLYLGFREVNNGYKPTVMKYGGDDWVVLGKHCFTDSITYFTSLAIDNNNIPYMAFEDFANGYKASVMKFENDKWVYVGKPGFTEDTSKYITLAFDENNSPYIVYENKFNKLKGSVMKFDGSDWSFVGESYFTTDSAGYISLKFNYDNIPYVIYSDKKNNQNVTIKYFNNSTFVSENISNNKLKFSISPNPTSDIIKILANFEYFTNYEFKICDVLGEMVFSKKYSSIKGINDEINIKEFNAGLYYCSISSGKYLAMEKVVVVK